MFGGMYHVALEQVLVASKSRQLKLFYDMQLENSTLESVPIHSESCCTNDLSSNEWNLIDEAVETLECISVNERSTLFYVAGFLMLKENCKCVMDDEVFEMDNSTDSDSEFTRLYSRGKLTYPSQELFYFTMLAYSFFKSSSILCRARLVKCLSLIHDNFASFECNPSLFRRLANVFYSGLVKSITDIHMQNVHEDQKGKNQNVSDAFYDVFITFLLGFKLFCMFFSIKY